MLTDTHCHLNHERFAEDRDAAIGRALDAGIKRLLVIGYDLASSRFALEIAAANRCVQAVIGVHPESADEWSPEAAAELSDLARQRPGDVVGWGEIGLDYHWDSVPQALQRSVFEQQLETAAAASVPAVLHCRDAFDDVLDTIEQAGHCRAVLHCFTGSREQAQRAVSLGLYIGVGGIATFPKSQDLRDAIELVPLDRILIETDSPYLAPQPWRGKRNEPAYVRAVAQMLAQMRSLTVDEIGEITTRNCDALFGAAAE